jgi:hypothetical protein
MYYLPADIKNMQGSLPPVDNEIYCLHNMKESQTLKAKFHSPVA